LRKFTAPGGVELDAIAPTVAVRVTLWPLVAGFGETVRLVVVATGPGVAPPPELEEPPHPVRRVAASRVTLSVAARSRLLGRMERME
jgi:hypothetical protein